MGLIGLFVNRNGLAMAGPVLDDSRVDQPLDGMDRLVRGLLSELCQCW